MTHEVDGENKTPHIGESHDQTFDRGEFEAILDGYVDQADGRTTEDNQLIASVGADGVQKTTFGFTVTGIDIFAK